MACWWDWVVIPVRRVRIDVAATRIAVRETGLQKLREEVRTCEYEDVRVMWEMLRKTDSEFGRYPPAAKGCCNKTQRRRRRRHLRRGRARSGAWDAVLGWSLCNLCCNF